MSRRRTSGMAYTKLPIAAPACPPSILALVRKSIRLQARTVICRCILVPGLCGRVIASSKGLLGGCVPFALGAGLASAAIVGSNQYIKKIVNAVQNLEAQTSSRCGAEPRSASLEKNRRRQAKNHSGPLADFTFLRSYTCTTTCKHRTISTCRKTPRSTSRRHRTMTGWTCLIE